MDKNDIFKELDELLTSPIPNFKKIEDALRKIPPAFIAFEIQENVGFTYLLDYYLRHIDFHLVQSILQNPLFTHDALIELFYCQITAYHKAILQKKACQSLSETYWSCLSKAEFAVIFKNIHSRPSNLPITKLLLEKVDSDHIKLMLATGSLKSHKMLEFFKSLGTEIKQIATQNLNFFEFAFNLAIHESDHEYLLFLEDYTTLFVQLRVASFFVDEIKQYINKNNHLPDYNQLVEILNNVPTDSINVTLDLIKDKSWITEAEEQSLLEFFQKKSRKGLIIK